MAAVADIAVAVEVGFVAVVETVDCSVDIAAAAEAP